MDLEYVWPYQQFAEGTLLGAYLRHWDPNILYHITYCITNAACGERIQVTSTFGNAKLTACVRAKDTRLLILCFSPETDRYQL